MELYSRIRRQEVRTDLIPISVVPRTYHRPVFDCFQYVESIEAIKNGRWEGLVTRLICRASIVSGVLP